VNVPRLDPTADGRACENVPSDSANASMSIRIV
jgi:hypothetical protein